MSRLLLGLGANLPGPWGPPQATLSRARCELARAGLEVIRSSRIYATSPLGPGRQAPYLNAVLLIGTHLAPAVLLRLAKRIERRAGRKVASRWAPRTLDVDLLDLRGKQVGWPSRRRHEGRLVLPHPEMHRRAFVLVPLLEVARHWRHPVLGVSAATLLAGLPRQDLRSIGQTLDFADSACEKPPQ